MIASLSIFLSIFFSIVCIYFLPFISCLKSECVHLFFIWNAEGLNQINRFIIILYFELYSLFLFKIFLLHIIFHLTFSFCISEKFTSYWNAFSYTSRFNRSVIVSAEKLDLVLDRSGHQCRLLPIPVDWLFFSPRPDYTYIHKWDRTYRKGQRSRDQF